MTKFNKLVDKLTSCYVERDEIAELLVASVLAQRHVAFIGPPGTAKSSLIRDLAAGLGGLRFFDWLLTEYTVPEELFGPLNIAALEQGQYRRLTTNKLPEAEVVFLDEVFKAGSSILNTLLTVMEERLFHNNGTPTPVPLVSLIGASNETPAGEEALEALWDRFTIRLQASYIQEPGNFVRMLSGTDVGNVPMVVTRPELEDAQEAVRKVTITPDILNMVVDIRRALQDRGIIASDRRYKQSLDLLRAVAFLDGRQEVCEGDLLVLQHVLWHDPNQHQEVARLVFAVAEPLLVGIAEVEDDALAAINAARRLGEGEINADAMQKLFEHASALREALQKLESVEEQVGSTGKAAETLRKTHARVTGWKDEIMDILGMT